VDPGIGGDDPIATMHDLIASLPTATSRTDAHQILLRRHITAFATQHACEAILWANSTTRLAERTLAETAKGRGASLPHLISDATSASGVQSFYPIRELLSKEIIAYTSLTSPPLTEIIVHETAKPPVSTKNTSIDDLMRQYFESVEREYPSVVANVVRTAGKLQASVVGAKAERCELCDLPLVDRAPARSRLCYGCIRTLPLVDV